MKLRSVWRRSPRQRSGLRTSSSSSPSTPVWPSWRSGKGKPDEAVAHVMAAIRLIEFSPEVRIGEAYAIGLRANADAADLARARRSPDQARSAVEAGDRLLEAIRARHADVLRQRPAYATLSAAWLVLSRGGSDARSTIDPTLRPGARR